MTPKTTLIGILSATLLFASCDQKANKQTNSAQQPQSQSAQSLIGKPVKIMGGYRVGDPRVRGVIEQEAGDRCKVTVTWMDEYSANIFEGDGYGRVSQGQTVWTRKSIWTLDN